jgi:hypothetical protein
MQARHIVTALAVVAAGTVAVAPASAAKPKAFKGSKQVTDATPDPTATGTDGSDCSSLVPAAVTPMQDAPSTTLKIAGLGKLKVDLVSTGDWALEIRDPKGIIIGSSDGGSPQDQELATVKTKKAGSYKVWACNLGGSPNATLSWAWTPA